MRLPSIIRLLKTRTLVFTLALILATFAFYPGVMPAEAETHGVWTRVEVDPACYDTSGGVGVQQYLYNVDENADGYTDYAVWFYESDRLDFTNRFDLGPGGSFEIGQGWLLDEPGRALHQWAFAWFGYRATGACNLDGHWNSRWEVRPGPFSTYAGSERRLQLSMDIGVAYDTDFTVVCYTFFTCNEGQTYSIRADAWSANPGIWARDNYFDPDFLGQPIYHDLYSWAYFESDWETIIAQGGHPPHPLRHLLATSYAVPNVSECAGVSGIVPHGSMHVVDPDGPATGEYGSWGDLQADLFDTYVDWVCWIVVKGPTALITHSPNEALVGQTFSFDGSKSADSDGWISSYSWDFGDGTVGSGRVVSHAYGSPGTYTVSLTVTDNSGITDTTTTTVTVIAFSRIEGTVRNAAGSAIGGTRVTVTLPSGSTQAVYTDASGNYVFHAGDLGTHRLAVQPSGYTLNCRPVTVSAPATVYRADFTVSSGTASIAPIYVTGSGGPVSGASVGVYNCYGARVYSGRTDSRGMAPGISGLTHGTFVVYATWAEIAECPDQGYAWRGSVTLTLPPNQSPTINTYPYQRVPCYF